MKKIKPQTIMNMDTKRTQLRLIGVLIFAVGGYGLAQTISSETNVRLFFGCGVLLGLALFINGMISDKLSKKRRIAKNAQGNNVEGKQ